MIVNSIDVYISPLFLLENMLQIQNQMKSDPADKPVLSQMTRDPMCLSAHQEHP